MAKLEKLLKEKCKSDIKLKWPILFKRFINVGFGILEGNKLNFEYWVTKFNLLQETITIDKFKFGNEEDLLTCLSIRKKTNMYISQPKAHDS